MKSLRTHLKKTSMTSEPIFLVTRFLKLRREKKYQVICPDIKLFTRDNFRILVMDVISTERKSGHRFEEVWWIKGCRGYDDAVITQYFATKKESRQMVFFKGGRNWSFIYGFLLRCFRFLQNLFALQPLLWNCLINSTLLI